MNRQYKRMMQKEQERRAAAPRVAPVRKERTKPTQFVKEVGAELRKVHWPNRQEVVAYTLVVVVASAVMATLIVAMDFGFAKAILALFGVNV